MTLAGFDQRDFGMLISLFRMTLTDRFLGSALGLVWAVLAPLMLMGIFCFVFTFVFPGRLPGRARGGPLALLGFLPRGGAAAGTGAESTLSPSMSSSSRPPVRASAWTSRTATRSPSR